MAGPGEMSGNRLSATRKSGSSAAIRRAITTSLALVGITTGCTASPVTPLTSSPAAKPTRICGQATLHSPYIYAGRPGPYRSGTAGLPTYGVPGSDFPKDTAGVVLPTGKHTYLSYQLRPGTVYYLLPGLHIGSIQADRNDAFVGGLAHGNPSVLSGEYGGDSWAIDSNFSDGDQPGVTIEYLTIEKFQPQSDGAAVNQSSNTNWTLQDSTITLNAPGAGMIAGAENTLVHNCLTLNGQYGFQSSDVGSWGHDALTSGPYDVTVRDNEISYNDTCDFEGLLSNRIIGWWRRNPVPPRYRNPHCGTITGDGNQGGFKLWQTDGVTIEGNYIHDNWGPGIWADTDNANTTYVHNVITHNDGQAIIEEISYNFSITGNYLADNGWAAGLDNPGFPTPAIYISESGSDTEFGGIPACPESACAGQASYRNRSVISRNTLVNNGGSILLWQNSDRYCSAGYDDVCTLVREADSSPFTVSGCRSNLPTASVDFTTYSGKRTGTPAYDWWDGCLWKTENVAVTGNVIDFAPASIAHCTRTDWPSCGVGGIFSEYGVAVPYNVGGGWVIPSQLTFFQHNNWSHNVYHGPSIFYAWNQGNGYNPLSWAAWAGKVSRGDRCGSPGEHQSGYCAGPFGQDAASTYANTPPAPAPLSAATSHG